MTNLDDLLNTVKSLSRKQATLLIGIDGFGGSGKSTVAKFLKERLENVVIVEMDDFYLPALKRADYLRVKQQVLQPLDNNLIASYQRYDWRSDTLAEWHTIHPGGIVIIEGVYSTHSDLANHYDFKIWVDCPQEIGFKRGVERDKRRDGVDNTDKWLTLWMPQEKLYAETQKPKERADYIADSS